MKVLVCYTLHDIPEDENFDKVVETEKLNEDGEIRNFYNSHL